MKWKHLLQILQKEAFIMANKINVKLILELRDAGMSRNAIASTRHMSRHSVSDVLHIADAKGIVYKDIQNLGDQEVYRLFYPDKHAVEDMYRDPDYEYINKELKKVGVNLKLLWSEYKDKCSIENEIAMGYTKFCEGYGNYTFSNKLTNHLEHKPGIVAEVDWSGSTMSYVDIDTEEIISVHLFVATLPYSQYSYVEACPDMKQDTWLRCHTHMYEFFNGVTIRTVCDNLKTGVIKHPREGDIILNAAYEALGAHYRTAIMPTGVRKPKQKASVEGTVGKIATSIIASLRNEIFYSLQSLQVAVKKKLDEFNRKAFQKREYSRYEVFQEEKTYLNPLPVIPYEIATWVYGRSINLNCHVIHGKNHYSCPYQYVGKKADLKVTDTKLEIYIKGERVATHTKFPEYATNRYSTHKEDMPDQFQQPVWDDERIMKWAYSIGSATGEVINRIFASVNIKEQGYNPSLSVLRLSKTYSQERLETACEMALTKVRMPRYHHLKAILAANQDRMYQEKKNSNEKKSSVTGYVRGAEYYGGSCND
jgi:transposase